MDTQTMSIRVSPEVLDTIIHDVTSNNQTFGVYSSMTETLTGGTNNTSLLTGLTVPILLVQNTVDVGYYSVFDGAISQMNVVNNFLFSSTTTNPYVWNVYNTSDIEFNAYLQLAAYRVDWGDGSPIQSITSYAPNSLVHNYPATPAQYTITLLQTNPWVIRRYLKIYKFHTLMFQISTHRERRISLQMWGNGKTLRFLIILFSRGIV